VRQARYQGSGDGASRRSAAHARRLFERRVHVLHAGIMKIATEAAQPFSLDEITRRREMSAVPCRPRRIGMRRSNWFCSPVCGLRAASSQAVPRTGTKNESSRTQPVRKGNTPCAR